MDQPSPVICLSVPIPFCRPLYQSVLVFLSFWLLLVKPGDAHYYHIRRVPIFGVLSSRATLSSKSRRDAFSVCHRRVVKLRAGATDVSKDGDIGLKLGGGREGKDDNNNQEREDNVEEKEEGGTNNEGKEEQSAKGGEASEKEDLKVDAEGDAEDEGEYDYEEEEDDDEEEEEESVETMDDTVNSFGAKSEGIRVDVTVQKYDEPWFPSPFANLYIAFGVMMLAKRIDVNNPTVIKICRLLYILYVVGLQVFLIYVRARAKAANDRTPITISNPLSGLLQSQLDGIAGGAGSMMKTLASSFLSSSISVLEYDLKEANNMLRGILFNMAILWFMHFKMKQLQPLLIQTANGLLNLFYSPLFQIYVMGRNLERPFKTQTSQLAKLQEQAKSAQDAEVNNGSTAIERIAIQQGGKDDEVDIAGEDAEDNEVEDYGDDEEAEDAESDGDDTPEEDGGANEEDDSSGASVNDEPDQ